MKFLFLLKKRSNYGSYTDTLESGLLNSARMTMEELIDNFDIKADLSLCVDGNSVDRNIHFYKPDVVVIEALWVTPAKLRQLRKLHPRVIFIIRIHSEIPFLANEGIAIEWCKQYSCIPNVILGFNSQKTFKDFTGLISSIVHLPNLYRRVDKSDNKVQKFVSFLEGIIRKRRKRVIDVGCFGSIRPMKNQLLQAVAAMKFAERNHLSIRFHMNVGRLEQGGEPVLKNIRALFENTKHKLIEHSWLDRDDFLKLVKDMEVGMQVSMNESFNIVTADFVLQDVPIVVSDTIDWMPHFSRVKMDDLEDIIRQLESSLKYKNFYTRENKKALIRYNNKSIEVWGKLLKTICKAL